MSKSKPVDRGKGMEGKDGPPVNCPRGLKTLERYAKIAPMDHNGQEDKPAAGRPACFGNEARYILYLETADPEAECAKCPASNSCGEYILLQCSREVIF
ncbi:MAG: hypothetical protein HY697_04905 [Deltaproteobacteria bacterium]|nr:hypothetical protein [Deltaproteobacteria bacterium]